MDITDLTDSTTPDDDMAATQPDAVADAVVATLGSAEPMPAAGTAQAPRMLGEFETLVVLVIGLGESGLATAHWCAHYGVRVRVVDTREAPANLSMPCAYASDAEFMSGPSALPLLDGVTLVAINPGLSSLGPNVAAPPSAASTQSVSMWGEIELFAHAPAGLKAVQGYAPYVLAITGMNGKTTTMALTGALVQRSGKTVGVVGSISPSASDRSSECVDADTLPDVWVLELSSFQFETTHTLDVDAATVLNVAQDHLNWHNTLEAYAAAKGRTFSANTVRVLNRQDAGVMAFASKNGGDIIFGTGKPGTPDALGLPCDGGMLWIVLAETEQDKLPKPTRRKKGDNVPVVAVPVCLKCLMPAGTLRICGLRNVTNAMVVLALRRAIGLPASVLLHGLRDYAGEPHCVKLIIALDDIEFFDDSKDTNIGVVVAALSGLSKHVVLIAGGDGKGQGFLPLAEPVVQYVWVVIFIGCGTPLIREVLASTSVVLIDAPTLEAAVQEAAVHAQPGDTVLLSSACASFDTLRSYGHHAQVFYEAVVVLAIDRGVPL